MAYVFDFKLAYVRRSIMANEATRIDHRKPSKLLVFVLYEHKS